MTETTSTNGETIMLEKIRVKMDQVFADLENAINAVDNEAAKIHASILKALHDLSKGF